MLRSPVSILRRDTQAAARFSVQMEMACALPSSIHAGPGSGSRWKLPRGLAFAPGPSVALTMPGFYSAEGRT